MTDKGTEKAGRLLRIRALAEATFGDGERANRWLCKPLGVLGGKAPLDVAQTDRGARIVETILAKITWGGAA